MTINGNLYFRTLDQVALFDMEISGQLSDGHWENFEPHEHWRPWCEATCRVALQDESPGRDFHVYTWAYDLTSHDLLDVVGYRMRVFVRFTRHFGLPAAKLLENCLDLEGNFRGSPVYEDYGTHTTWADIRRELEAYDMGEVQEIAESEDYTHEELLADLREIQEAMSTYLGEDQDRLLIADYPEDYEPDNCWGCGCPEWECLCHLYENEDAVEPDDDDCCGGSCPGCPR